MFDPLPNRGGPQDATYRHWLRYEILLCLLGLYTTIALVVRAGIYNGAAVQAAFVTGVFFCFVTLCCRKPDNHWQKLRFGAGYLYVFWYFQAIAAFVPALGQESRDPLLLAMDEHLFGVTPAVWMQSIASVAMTELMSVCYLSFVVYLHVAVIYAAWMPNSDVRRFSNWLFSVYAIGLPGYLLVPALGPGLAFPELFDEPIHGWLFTSLNQGIVDGGSSVYSVFPSLHLLITLTLLEFDRRHHPRRFRIMLLPAFGLIVSTMYLRYHYAIDLLVGAEVFLIAVLLFRERRPVDVATGQ